MTIEYTGQPVWYQKVITELLEYTAVLLQKHGITFWLDAGNLLGAMRNGKAIPHDYDGDMGIFESDIERIEALSEEIKADGYNSSAIKRGQRTHVFKIWKNNPDFHNDLWPCFITENKIVQNIHISHFHVPLIDITNMQSIMYEGKEYPCPDNVEQLIISRYGKNFRTYGECMESSIKLIRKYDPTNTEILAFIENNLTIKA